MAGPNLRFLVSWSSPSMRSNGHRVTLAQNARSLATLP
jgi:hypothetical protein